MNRLLRFFLAATIVPGIQAPLAVAATVSEDVPVPGGTAAVAAAFRVQPVPDRPRFVAELTRLVYGPTDQKPFDPVAVTQELRRLAAAAGGRAESVPVPLSADVWSDAVFRREVAPADLFASILSDRQAALLCHGLAALDDETLQYFVDHPAVLGSLYASSAEAFAVYADGIRVRLGRVVTPGGEEAEALWESVVGETVARPDRFVPALFARADGRLASLYAAIGQLDPPRQRFALGLWMSDRAARLAGMQALFDALTASTGDWRSLRTQPFVRQPYDLTALLARVTVEADGRPAAPASRGFWGAALQGGDLPADPAGLLGVSADASPVDAAWLAGLTTASDIRVRAERLDQFAFAQRVFGGATPAQLPDVLVATRAFRRYRMLMLTLDRLGLRDPRLFADAARLATRLSPPDRGRAFVATAQFQGALALLWRMRAVGTLDRPATEALVASLIAIPVSPSSQYLGGILRWLARDLSPAIPPGDTVEGAFSAALSGPPHGGARAPAIEWEGEWYRVDLAAAERRRLARVREKQSGTTLDVAFELAAAAERLASAPLTPAVMQDVRVRLAALAEELTVQARRGGVVDADGFPPGVVAPPRPQESLRRAIDELNRVGGAASQNGAPRAAAELVDAAERAAAQALVALVYAMNLGDPDGPALLTGDVSRRHDFGLGQRDIEQRLRAAWMMPLQDVSPGVPWHIDGSLLGLDVAMAPMAMRRLAVNRTLAAPTLSGNVRQTFVAGVGLINPFVLTDEARDAIASAIERGRRIVLPLREPSELARVADQLDMDGWRRRAIQWTAVHDSERLETFFSLRELMALGGTPEGLNLDPWGTAALVSTGCVCTRMPPPGRLLLSSGRRQIGLLASAMPDLNLHIARTLADLRLPARLAKYVLSAAALDFVDEVRVTDADDWLALVRGAAAVPLERIEDYVAAAAADGPLIPDSVR